MLPSGSLELFVLLLITNLVLSTQDILKSASPDNHEGKLSSDAKKNKTEIDYHNYVQVGIKKK